MKLNDVHIHYFFKHSYWRYSQSATGSQQAEHTKVVSALKICIMNKTVCVFLFYFFDGVERHAPGHVIARRTRSRGSESFYRHSKHDRSETLKVS